MERILMLKNIVPLAAGLLFVGVCSCGASQDEPAPYGVTPSAAQLKWHELEFYGFLHFTVNTFTDREWGDGAESETVFNPTDFSAEQIVSAAKAGGMKGLILTCKHHDGFCLWPSKYTEHSIKNSPYKEGKGDIVRELADECRRQGLKFGVYLSPWDRNHADYGKPEYITYFRNQLQELLMQYGPIFEIWFDGANGGTGYYGGANERRNIDRATYYEWSNTWDLVRKLQPEIIIFSDAGPGCRWVGNERGIAGDPCWETVTYPLVDGKPYMPGCSVDRSVLNNGVRNGDQWVPPECDVSIRPGWFYHKSQDGNVKSPEYLLDIYFKSVGRGGNFLLNIPPDRRGRIPEQDVASLKGFHELVDSIFAKNLAKDAVVQASNERGGLMKFSAANLLDGDRDTYWATDDAVTAANVVFSFKKPVTFSVVDIREYIPLGQRVYGWALDYKKDGAWTEFAKGESIGNRRLWRGKQPITADAVRLRIEKSPICPCISEFGLYLEPGVGEKKSGKTAVKSSGHKGWKIAAVSYQVDGNAGNAIDGKPNTLWHTHDTKTGEHPAPQYIVVDMGKERNIAGFKYLPRADGCLKGIVDEYAFYISNDKDKWDKPVAEGEFSNILNNPIEQEVALKQPVKGRYFKFVAKHSAKANHISLAEIDIILAK